MKIKRYFASTMREAMRKVREEQGPDAVILSSEASDGGVELVAAVDYDAALLQQASRRESAAVSAPPEPASGKPDKAANGARATGSSQAGSGRRAPAAGDVLSSAAAQSDRSRVVWAQDPHLRRLQREMQDMRDLLAESLAQQTDAILRAQPGRARALQAFDRLGIDPRVARELAADIPARRDPKRDRSLPMGVLARRIPVADVARLDAVRRLAVIGPAGAGKTTTLAKLAARAVDRHGARNVALISLDTQRAGAEAQLGVYARLLGLPLRIAGNTSELRNALAACADCAQVLVDTAGLGPADHRLAGLLPQLAPEKSGLRSLLVLPANVQREDLLAARARFAPARPVALALTKVDECSRLGGALSALVSSPLPLAWISDGQQVPQDLHKAKAADLVMRAVRLARQNDPNTTHTEVSLEKAHA